MKSMSTALLIAFVLSSAGTARADVEGQPGWGTYVDARCGFGGDKDTPDVCDAHVTACTIASGRLCQSVLTVVCRGEQVFSGQYRMEVTEDKTKVTAVPPPTDVNPEADGLPVIIAEREDRYPAKVGAFLRIGEERLKGRCFQRLLTGPDFPDGI